MTLMGTADTAPRYAVIIVTYQRDEAVRLTLDAVMGQTVGRDAMEICVVDNGGTAGARELWRKRVDVWVDAEHNLRCAGGRNRGVSSTKAPVLVFVDDDGIPAADFVERLGDVLDNHDDVIAVRGRAEALHHPIFTAMAGHYDRGPHECEDLLTLEGGSAIRREAYQAVDGYDDSRAYHEGIELSGRLLEAHPESKILYTPTAVLKHDYVQGWRHLAHKARMMAVAESRVVSENNPHIRAMLDHQRSLRLQDGRRPWQKLVGGAMLRAFKAAVRYYRFRGPAQ